MRHNQIRVTILANDIHGLKPRTYTAYGFDIPDALQNWQDVNPQRVVRRIY